MSSESGPIKPQGRCFLGPWWNMRHLHQQILLTDLRTSFGKRVCFAVPVFVWWVSVCGCCVGSVWMSGGGGWEVVKIIPVLIRLTRPSSANRGEDRNTASQAEGRFSNNQAVELGLFAEIFAISFPLHKNGSGSTNFGHWKTASISGLDISIGLTQLEGIWSS